MEPRLGHDFRYVRVHNDAKAGRAADAVNALAFTVGHHLVFGAGRYNPETASGKGLLAHELTHAIQQGHRGDPSAATALELGPCHDSLESAADASQERLAEGKSSAKENVALIEPRLQRKSIGSSIRAFFSAPLRLFGVENYADDELLDYHDNYLAKGVIEDNYDSDNKARAIVKRWKNKNLAFTSEDGKPQTITLDLKKKIVLGKEMYQGHRSKDDVNQELDLLSLSDKAEVPALIAGIGEALLNLEKETRDFVRTAVVSPPPKPLPLPATVPIPGPTDFEITRVEASTVDEIFFAKDSSSLNADAQTQVASIKSSPPPSVKLLGFSSADETATVAQARAVNVKAELTKSPGAVSVTSAVGNAGAKVGQANFPSVRKVEVVVGSAPAKTFDCKAKDGTGKLIHPPKQPCPVMDPATQSAFNSALTIANNAMTRASAAVAGAPSATDAAVIDQFFGNHDPGTLSTLKTNLGNLKTHVAGLPGITSCGGQCDSGGCDDGATIAYNHLADATSTMTLCVPRFKNLANDNDRARNLIHESAHGTTPLGGAAAPGEGTSDVAYRHERIMFQLSTAERLRNSDSYALFALFLRERQITANPAAVPAGILTPANDNITGFSAPPELAAVKTAVAKLEKRLSWASDWMGQLYGQIIKVQAGPVTWAGSWAGPLMAEAAKRFPLTAPPAPPTLLDQTREAGILDRYRRMKGAVKRNLTITRMAAGVVTWPAGGSSLASSSLQIGPDFFAATSDDQISLLVESLAKATPDVEPAFIPAYVSLAAWIHDQNP